MISFFLLKLIEVVSLVRLHITFLILYRHLIQRNCYRTEDNCIKRQLFTRPIPRISVNLVANQNQQERQNVSINQKLTHCFK